MAETYATTSMPTHRARAVQMSVPTGCWVSALRIASTMEVTGWWAECASAAADFAVSPGTEIRLATSTGGPAGQR